MPHSPDDKKRAITRLRRIRGQAEALERSIAVGADSGAALQEPAARRAGVAALSAPAPAGGS